MLSNTSKLTSFLLLALPATFTLADPIPDPEASPLPEPIDAIANLAANTTARPKHQKKDCTLRLLGTWAGEGNKDTDEIWWHTYYIYNDRGEVIGRAANKPDVVRQGASLLSALPYTLDLRHLKNGGDYNFVKFCYASGCYEGNFQCVRYYVNNAPNFIGFVNDCQRKFDCGHK